MDRMVSLSLMRSYAGLAAMALAGIALPVAAQAQSGSLVAQWDNSARTASAEFA